MVYEILSDDLRSEAEAFERRFQAWSICVDDLRSTFLDACARESSHPPSGPVATDPLQMTVWGVAFPKGTPGPAFTRADPAAAKGIAVRRGDAIYIPNVDNPAGARIAEMLVTLREVLSARPLLCAPGLDWAAFHDGKLYMTTSHFEGDKVYVMTHPSAVLGEGLLRPRDERPSNDQGNEHDNGIRPPGRPRLRP